MILPQIAFVILILFYTVSCKDSVNEKHDIEQNNTKSPSTDYQKTEKPQTKRDHQIPVEKSSNKELKEKKLKKFDTLKPAVAIP